MNRKRVLDLATAALIGLAIVAGVGLAGWFQLFPGESSAKWWTLAAMTALLVWIVAQSFRRDWRKPAYWLHMSWLVALHIGAWTIVLVNVPVWGALWYTPPLVVEAMAFVVAFHKLGFNPSD